MEYCPEHREKLRVYIEKINLDVKVGEISGTMDVPSPEETEADAVNVVEQMANLMIDEEGAEIGEDECVVCVGIQNTLGETNPDGIVNTAEVIEEYLMYDIADMAQRGMDKRVEPRLN